MPDVPVRLMEFSDLIAGYTKDFVGREWLLEQVFDLLDDPDCRFVVLTGGMGVGKTAFMAHLAATHPQWPRYFLRRDSVNFLRPGDAKTFLLTVGGQLATLYPDLFKPDRLEAVVRQRIGDPEANGEVVAARVKELQASPFYRVAILAEHEIRRVAGKATGVEIGRLISQPRLISMQDLQYLGLLDPAWLLYQIDPEARIVVLVDALDALRYRPAEDDIVYALSYLSEIPPNLRFVLSSRRETLLYRLLRRSDARELPLDAMGEQNRADLQIYVEANLAHGRLDLALARQNRTWDGFVQDLLDRAAGNFLLLRSYLASMGDALAQPDKEHRLDALVRGQDLPKGLDALYNRLLASTVDSVKRGFAGDACWRRYLRPLLGTLAVAREPLSEEQLMAFTDLDRWDFGYLLSALRQFLVLEDDRLRLYSSFFTEYLLDIERNVDYGIDERKAHQRIVEYYMKSLL
jgi:hypothetical protein